MQSGHAHSSADQILSIFLSSNIIIVQLVSLIRSFRSLSVKHTFVIFTQSPLITR